MTRLVASLPALADEGGWVTSINAFRQQRSAHHAPWRYHGILSDFHSLQHYAPGRKPRAAAQDYGFDDQIHRPIHVVRACGDEGFLGYYCVVFNRHETLVMDPYALAYPAVIPNLQVPGKLHAHTWSHNNVGADACSEQPQRPYLKGRRGLQGIGDQQELHDHPQRFDTPAPGPFEVTGTCSR